MCCSGTAQIMNDGGRLAWFPVCCVLSHHVLQGGLYVVEHEEVQRYDLCMYYGGRIRLWDLIQ